MALLLLTGINASWCAPFGWEAWGRRLMLPVIPAVALIGVVIYGEELERAFRVMLATAPDRGSSPFWGSGWRC